jgi:hypothetical protein
MAYEDLLKDTSQYVENGDYYLLTITDLDINTSYPIQFRWKKKDGTFSVWSGVRTITTPGESTPATPSTLVVTGGAGILTITWDGKDALGNTMTNLDRLDIYIDGSPFDATRPAASFFVAGTQTVSAPAGTYIVAAYAVSKAGTRSAINDPVTRVVTSNVPAPANSVTPSTPTVSSVLGAIQLSWNGKTSTGGDQPFGFDAAKVYIGTSTGFTPSSSNQVDTLNFANGQNTLNIGVGTIVNGVALTYGVDYYVKIATTNGTDTSTAVSASGNPVKIGQVTSGDIVTITADKIATGTLDAGSTVTVGSSTGKRVVLAGTGDPLTVYDTDGTTKLLSYSTTSGRLSIVGDGSFTGNLSIGSSDAIFKAEPATGIWLGNSSYSSAPFRVSTNGVIRANSGTIGGWTLAASYLENSAQTFQINSSSSTMFIGPYSSGDHIRISASGGIQHTNSSGSATGKFTLTPNGNLTISGTFTIDGGSTIDGTSASTVKSGAASGSAAVQPGNGVAVDGSWQITRITPSSGLTISTASSGSRVEINNLGLKAYNGTTNTVSINSDGTASFTGSITASSGSIGNWSISPAGWLTNGNTTLGPANANYAVLTTDKYIGATAFFASSTSVQSQFDGGFIAGPASTAVTVSTAGRFNVASGTPAANIYTDLTIGIDSTKTLTVNAAATFTSSLTAEGANNAATLTASPNVYMTTAGVIRKTSGSSIRYKEGVVDLLTVDALNPNKLYDLPVRAFKFKEEFTSEEDSRYHELMPGFIAEEVEEIYPIAADYDDDGVEKWNSQVMIPAMLALIQDLNKRLDALEG